MGIGEMGGVAWGCSVDIASCSGCAREGRAASSRAVVKRSEVWERVRSQVEGEELSSGRREWQPCETMSRQDFAFSDGTCG
jgi:hypothetical protein